MQTVLVVRARRCSSTPVVPAEDFWGEFGFTKKKGGEMFFAEVHSGIVDFKTAWIL